MSCYTTMEFLEGAEIAREMTDEELLAHIKNRC